MRDINEARRLEKRLETLSHAAGWIDVEVVPENHGYSTELVIRDSRTGEILSIEHYDIPAHVAQEIKNYGRIPDRYLIKKEPGPVKFSDLFSKPFDPFEDSEHPIVRELLQDPKEKILPPKLIPDPIENTNPPNPIEDLFRPREAPRSYEQITPPINPDKVLERLRESIVPPEEEKKVESETRVLDVGDDRDDEEESRLFRLFLIIMTLLYLLGRVFLGPYPGGPRG